MKSNRALALFAVAATLLGAVSANAEEKNGPTLVELFTSQGCSSCPPADAILADLAKRPDVVALGFHVDYWDRLGWRDPFSSAEATARQYSYSRALGNSNVYTPQMVIGGKVDIVGSRRNEILAAIDADSKRPKAALAITSDGGGALRLDVPALSSGSIEMWLARYDRSNVTEVGRGENAGRRLGDVNAVREIVRLEMPQDGSRSLRIPAPARGSGVAVWVQEAGLGRVLATGKFDAAS